MLNSDFSTTVWDMDDGRLPDPARLIEKQKLEIQDVRRLLPYAKRYGFRNYCRIQWLLARLLREASTSDTYREIEELIRAFENTLDPWPKQETWLKTWAKDKKVQ